MSKRSLGVSCRLLIAMCLNTVLLCTANAENLRWSKRLTGEDARRFAQLFQSSHWSIDPDWESSMVADAKVSRSDLNGDGRKEFLYLIEGIGWCGTGGCKLLIGEARDAGTCHLLYDGDGFANVTVLRSRDHGYRRLYAPCELRFDGREYRQIHPDCPTLGSPR